MQHKFCSVFKLKKQMYLVRQANANGPNCIVWPPKPMYGEMTQAQLSAEIQSALNDYVHLGRTIYAPEKEQMTEKLLGFFGEKSVSAFERKKKDIVVREDVALGVFSLFDGGTGLLLCELHSLGEVASKVLELLGPPAMHPPATT